MKVAIIGCGITGAYLAWKLALAGHDVTVFEKKQIIGKEACSGQISERLWNFIPENKELVENEISHAKIHFSKRTANLKFRQKMLVISRAKLDNYVARLAEKAGAKIIRNKIIIALPEGFDRVIGADGALSETRKLLGLKEPGFRQGMQFFIRGKSADNIVETWPVENGFIWKIPRGNETEYGIMADLKTAREKLNDFCAKNNLKVLDLKAALIPCGLITSKNQKIALCGDSSGLTKPWSGGGVIWSLTAANILLKNFPDFEKYHLELKRFLAPKLWKTKLITWVGYFLGNYLPWLLPDEREIDSDWLLAPP